jgi:hypothetical protein
MLLLLIIIYVFSLVFTQAATDHLLENRYYTTLSVGACVSSDPLAGEYLCVLDLYWGSLAKSTLTLFKGIAGGLSWDVAVQPFTRLNRIWEFIFIGYISFTYLAVLNVVTGVFCPSAIEGAQHDHDLMVQAQLANKEMHVKRIKELFQTLDSDASGVITFKELSKHIEDAEVKAFFDSMDLCIADAWTLFKLLDNDQTHEIDAEEFVDGVMRLRGVAKSIDMAKLMHDQLHVVKTLERLAKHLYQRSFPQTIISV